MAGEESPATGHRRRQNAARPISGRCKWLLHRKQGWLAIGWADVRHPVSSVRAHSCVRPISKLGCALRVVERRPLFCDSVVKDQIGSFLCHFPSAKHIFKASVACNGREVLRGTPEGRHGISAIEATDCLGNREPTIHWKVSRTSAACREGSRKHLSPSAMRSEPVGRIGGFAVISRLRQSHAPSSLKGRFLGVQSHSKVQSCSKNCISPLFYGAKKKFNFFLAAGKM